MITDTIVAQCTPRASGAIALLRITGPQAFSIAEQCSLLSSRQKLTVVPTHTIHHGWVTAPDGSKLDEVLFLVMHAPRTFTGEHTVEITCHNNQFLIELLIERIIACGARPAQAGEFTRLAVENNKLDLVQAEAINELVHANSQQGLRQALDQLQGTLSQHLANLELDVLRIIGLCEASFEFLEEDVDFSEDLRRNLHKVTQTIAALKKSFDQQNLVRQGVRIALIGTVNAGKSSLFNVLIGKNRAIVTNIAGTTRDVIEAGLYHEGMYRTFVDTAGLRTTNDIIEQQGIERSYQEAEQADIVLLINDASRILTESEQTIYTTLLNRYPHKSIVVNNKIDVAGGKHSLALPDIIVQLATSSQSGEGIEELHRAISAMIEILLTKTDCPFLLNKRQMVLLASFEQKIHEAAQFLEKPVQYELLAHHLKEAVAILAELTGKSVSEKAMDMIFKDFCVGK